MQAHADRGLTPFDVAVIGAGCIGASIAKHLAEAGHAVVVLEKEARPAMHQSGRNSGVIHAGYNLTPGSDKARYCVEGSHRMRAYCRERGVPMVQSGIVVVATEARQAPIIEELLQRGRANGVAVHRLDEQEIRELEPAAVGVAGLHAPDGASVDSVGYVQALVDDAVAAGADVRFGVAVQNLRDPRRIRTNRGDVTARVVVNAAGLHADRLARHVAPDLRVVPFRGDYADLTPAARALVRSHVYAVPDPRLPFLGVHLSRRVDGTVSAGPGAMLAFGREAYRFRTLHPSDLAATLAWPGFWRMLTGAGVLSHLPGEVHKSLRLKAIWKEARALVPALRPEHLVRGRAGVRAQVVDRQGHLVDDIVVRCSDDAVHVLNAVSPGLTCSLPFGEHVANLAAERI